MNRFKLLVLLILIPVIVLSQGLSLSEKPQAVTAQVSMVSDSGRIIFYYQTRSNPIDTAMLLPRSFDSTTLEVSLPADFFDSTGGLLVDIEVYHRNSLIISEVLGGTWQHAPTIGGSGGGIAGPNELLVYAIDSTTGDTLSDIDLYVRNATATLIDNGISNSSGYVIFNLFADTWTIQAGTNSTIWNFDDITAIVDTLFDTVSILGYPTVILPPADPSLAMVSGYVRDPRNQPDSGVIVTIWVKSINQSTGSITLGDKQAVDTTDAAGFFDFNGGIIRSTEYTDSTFYYVSGKFDKKTKFTVDSLWIPATGNIDITDEINAR